MSDNQNNIPTNMPLNDITNILQDYISNQMSNPTIVFPTTPQMSPFQQSWGNNTGVGHFGIGMHSSMNPMNHIAAMSSNPFGNPFGNTFTDILQRSMDDSDYPNRPTDKDVVDKLPIVEILNDTTQCAICQDTLVKGTNAIKLPCSDTPHYFCIGDSPDKCEGIIPWLEQHNTCPVCRFELPEQKKEEEEKEEPPDLEEITESADTPNVIEPITVPMPPIPITPLTSLINTLLQQEMSNLDDEGFDMREYEEAIHRSLDGRDATAQEAASGDIEEKNNDDAGTDSD